MEEQHELSRAAFNVRNYISRGFSQSQRLSRTDWYLDDTTVAGLICLVIDHVLTCKFEFNHIWRYVRLYVICVGIIFE